MILWPVDSVYTSVFKDGESLIFLLLFIYFYITISIYITKITPTIRLLFISVIMLNKSQSEKQIYQPKRMGYKIIIAAIVGSKLTEISARVDLYQAKLNSVYIDICHYIIKVRVCERERGRGEI